jgi:hypothetical protein
MVIAVIALLVALAGTAVATTSKLSGPQVKQVVKIVNRRIGKRAPKLSVDHARTADSAGNAASLGGVAASSYARQSDLAPVPETPLALNNGWQTIYEGEEGSDPPRGYRDRFGVVHLAGLIGQKPEVLAGDPLTLPSDLRPRANLEFSTVCDVEGLIFDPRPGILVIEVDGSVRGVSTPVSNCRERLSLDGITFRAAG